MKFLWCDIETTGLETSNAKPFQIAFIFVYSSKDEDKIQKAETERIYYLNPYGIPGIEHSLEAEKIHGYSKEKIESFTPAKEVVSIIKKDLADFCRFSENEKLIFCGYNCNFDYEHLKSLFSVFEEDFSIYFQDKLDVFEQVKRASEKKILPYLPNRKLTTVADYLNIDLSQAHDALADIKATREVAKSLTQKGIKLF